MIRLRIFGRCRIYHDPVSPVMKEPATIGWTSWFRQIDLQTPRKLKGRELLMRTKGWWTENPEDVARAIEPFGKIVLGDSGELLVELQDQESAENLKAELEKIFNDQILIAP